MAELCRCQRCARIVTRNKGSFLRKVAFVSMYGATLPYAWMLFVAGPGVVGVLPIVIAMGLGINAGFSDWAFPSPRCVHCRASLEHAPVVGRQRATSAVEGPSMAE